MKVTRDAQKINLNQAVDISVDVHEDLPDFFFSCQGQEYSDEYRNRMMIIENCRLNSIFAL